MCSTKGYVFLAILVWNRVSILTILGWNRVWFGHSSLELGMFFGRSYFFIIWRWDHFHFNVYANRVHAVTACHMLWSHARLQIKFLIRSEIGKGKSEILVWKRVRVSGSVPHTPTQLFWKYPPGLGIKFLCTIFERKDTPFVYLLLTNGTPLKYLHFRSFYPF